LFFTTTVFGQFDISRPLSFQTDLISPLPTYTCPEVDVEQLLEEDAQQKADGFRVNRVGVSFTTNISPSNTGSWETIENFKVWRVRLYSENAYALKTTLSNFRIPKYASIFAYNEDRSMVLGPFTSDYNVKSKILPIPFVSSENIIIECVYDLEKVDFEPEFEISKIGHDYTNVLKNNPQHDEKVWDGILECHNDVNCQEGLPFQIEKLAVARIIFDDDIGEINTCTGTLVNTTTSSTIPYLLTANHCIDSEAEAASVSIYFNFERYICDVGNGPIDEIVCGSELLATLSQPVSDFTLLQLNARIPSSYRPFFAGWNRSRQVKDKGVVIHHPSGHEKKVTIADNLISENLSPIVDGNGNIQHNTGSVWIVDYTDGTTEGGSSGSPLFDVPRSNKPPRIIGTLSSGTRGCDIVDNFAKFDIAWTGGGTPETSLSDWLAPNGSNPTEMEGFGSMGFMHSDVGNQFNQPTSNKEIHKDLRALAIGTGNQAFYRGGDSKLQTLFLNTSTNSYQHGYLEPNASIFHEARGDVAVGDGNQVFYRGYNGHLHTYFYMNGNWVHDQIGGSSAPANRKVSSNCGSIAVGAGNQVFYRGADDKVHIYYWTPTNGWLHGFLGGSNAPSSHDVDGDLVVDKNNNNIVIYRGTDDKLHAYEYMTNSWGHYIINNTIHVNDDCGSIGLSNSGDIHFKGTDDRINVFDYNGTGWNHVSVTSSKAQDCDGISPDCSSIAVIPSSSHSVYESDSDGKMRIHYQSSGNWGEDWIETSWQAPGSHSPNGAIAVSSTGYVFYRGTNKRLQSYNRLQNYSKSINKDDFFSMAETPLSPTLPIDKEAGNLFNLVVRPNPVNDRFAIDIYSKMNDESAQIFLYDGLGRLMLNQTATLTAGGNTIKINVDELKTGIYYLQIIDSTGKQVTETIMKQ
jgi:hypothetical protein